ncbi:hypothetical protein INP83_11350 [Mucilaginibacter sp. 21P]|uniref:hypothetical protein n=1 Tax=Mucilaginibacter sp. 21P TaxID=2778902 RepID=UPI001C577C20|nr:hypothetical protein [Mucilaginibacter sp. 21P]QXV63706.1 hypothetical protein INP83_11350 [Mucilaginibacter sp. 21P]
MITLYDFHGMNMHDKAAATWEGVYLGYRTDDQFTIQLYSIGSFYAEIFYDNLQNKIVKIRGFRSTTLVEPYLVSITLNAFE